MSKNIKITSDSTCDLGNTLISEYDIAISPLSVILGDKAFSDGIDITPQRIFDYVAQTGILPKTAACPEELYAEFFENQLQNCDGIVHISVSSKISVSNRNACAAAKRFGSKVKVVDSLSLSSGQGLLTLKACDFARQGLAAKDIAAEVENLREKVKTSFVPHTLEYLHKGGRCSLAALMGAKVLKLHPMIVMENGELHAAKKYMGNFSRCIKNYISDLAAQYPNYDKSRCFITHSSCDSEFVEQAKQAVKENFNFDAVYETVAGSVITGHCGKNTLGVLFITL